MSLIESGCGCSRFSRRALLKVGSAATIMGLARTNVAALGQVSQGTRVIDTHAHFFPQRYLDVLSEEGKSVGAEYHLTPDNLSIASPAGNLPVLSPSIVDVHARIADMDKQGVDVQVVSLTNPMAYWGNEEISTKLSVAWNDATSEAHKAYPTRLFGFITLPMLYPDRALDELRRASKLDGMRGVYMGTNIMHRDLDDTLFRPVLAEIERLDIPIFLHPLQTVGAERTKPFYLSNTLGNPFDTAIAACHLIFGGVMDAYPKLRISLPHGGGALPMLIGRIDHGWKVRPETRSLPNAPSTYLQRFTYDTIVHSPDIMEFLIRQVGTERVLLGSDYCLDMGYEQPVRFLDHIDLTETQRMMIIGGNATRYLRL
jgi:aminocarboxymuconate-semialdehyde decarboxylase